MPHTVNNTTYERGKSPPQQEEGRPRHQESNQLKPSECWE
jgi:hypothetical protein